MPDLDLRNAKPTVWGGRLALSGILLLVCAAAYWVGEFGWRRSALRGDNSPFFIDESRLDFGEVWENQAFVWSLPVENRGRSALHVADIRVSCHCTQVEPRSLVLDPGERAEVRLTLDLAYNPPAELRAATVASSTEGVSAERETTKLVSDFSVDIAAHIETTDGQRILVKPMTVKGQIRRALSFSANAVSFGDRLIHGQTFEPRLITIKAHEPLQNLAAECDRAFASVSILPDGSTSEQPGAYLLQIQPREDLPRGPFSFTVTMTSVTKSGDALPTISLPVEGTVVDDLQVRPSKLVLGAHTVGDSAEESLLFWSWSGTHFEVVSIEGLSDEVTARFVGANDGAGKPGFGREYHVAQRIVKEGNRTGEIRFALRTDRGADPIAIVVPFSYFGIARAKER